MRLLPALAALALAGAARAEVVDSQPNGFEVTQKADIAAPAARVWQALSQVGAWWNSKHTFSQDAHNLSLELKPGGCFCETLPGGGGVRHMIVVWLQPGQAVRFSGVLGPLQSTGAAGHLTWTLKEAAGHTLLTQTYDVGGYAKGGLGTLAAPVDRVLGEQLGRLKAYVETGKPE